MKTCLALLIESDGPGGAERMVASLATALQEAGNDVVVIGPADGEGWLAHELQGTNVRLEPFRLGSPFSPALARWLARTFRRHRVALAHSHEFSMAVYGAWAARRAGVPHLFTMHGGRYYAERLRRRVALRVAATLSGAVVAVSESLRQHMSRSLWLPAARITLIPNGVRPSSIGQSSLREDLRLGPGDQLAVAVGNLYPVKGHRHLVDALGVLAARFPALHVAIAGRGELEDELRARARALNVGDRLHLLGLRGDVANVLAGADVFVLPSLSEGTPLALLEAMLARRPVIATAVGEVPAVLQGDAGLLVPPGDPAALADAIAAVLSDPARARRLAVAGEVRAFGEYTLTRMVARYTTVYAKLLGRPHLVDPFLEPRQVPHVETPVRRERTQPVGE